MDFIAMDYETANAKRASACSVALVVVENSAIVDAFYSLIDPEAEFYSRNIAVHGITPDQVAGAPTFAELWPHIEHFFTPTRIVTAHNASFDASVLKNSLDRYGIQPPHYQLIDTLKTSRQLLPGLENYQLNTVSAALNIPLEHHHNALEDSYACARILLAQAQQFGTNALNPWLKTA